MIMEAEKSHDMLSASWRLRKARAIIQFESEGLKTKRPLVGGPESKGLRARSSDVQGQEKMDVPAQEEREFTLSPPFCPLQALIRLDDAHPHC